MSIGLQFCCLILSSPTGQHFICCKDVASYLQSVGISSTRPNGQRDEKIPEYRPPIESVSKLSALLFGIFNICNEVYGMFSSIPV